MKSLEEKYAERSRTIQKRYRIFILSLLTALILFLPVCGFLDHIFPQNLLMPLILIYFSIFSLPGFVFAASPCPKCKKPLLALNGNMLRNITNFPNKCLHCGFHFFVKSRHLF